MKPVLLGMCNPHSADLAMALWPKPAGATGHRVLLMMQEADPSVTEAEYLAGFDRRNLLSGQKVWDKHAAHRTGPKIREQLEGRTVVVLGREVWNALGLVGYSGKEWIFAPHPSGANRWYNEPKNRVFVGSMLVGLLRNRP